MVQAAQGLGVSDYSLHKWRKQAKVCGELAFPGNGKIALTAEWQKNVRLKKEFELTGIYLTSNGRVLVQVTRAFPC